jgi:hypothetical protein
MVSTLLPSVVLSAKSSSEEAFRVKAGALTEAPDASMPLLPTLSGRTFSKLARGLNE